ncbi:hypothetical protein Tco_1469571 [Tanacetum coccineum]
MVANQIRPPGFPPIQVSIRIKEIISTKIEELISIKTVEITSTKDKCINLRLVNHRFTKLNLIKLPLRKCKFVNSNTASSLNSRSLPSNIVTNLKEDLKGITTRSGVAYKGPTIPTTSSPKIVERRTEVTKDTIFPTNNGITEDVQPLVAPVEK